MCPSREADQSGGMRCRLLGDSALVVELAASAEVAVVRRIQALCAQMQAAPLAGVLECVPAFVTLTVYFDPQHLSGDEGRARIEDWIARCLARATEAVPSETVGPREVVLRVRYGGDDGPDLPAVAAALGRSEEEVIALHAGASYVVGAIGFSPGFPYLLGLPSELHLPRRATPRPRVPAGSVAIAAGQAGIYPQATPGGWHLIGRTETVLFALERTPPALLAVGDQVRFVRETERAP